MLRGGKWVTLVNRRATQAELIEMQRVAVLLHIVAVWNATLFSLLMAVLLGMVAVGFWTPGILPKVVSVLCALIVLILGLVLIGVPDFRRVAALRRDIARGTIICCVGSSKAPVRRWYSSDDILWEMLPGSKLFWWKGVEPGDERRKAHKYIFWL